MDFFISDSFSNGSGQRFASKQEFLDELSRMIDDCESNGGVFFDVLVNTNASCFSTES